MIPRFRVSSGTMSVKVEGKMNPVTSKIVYGMKGVSTETHTKDSTTLPILTGFDIRSARSCYLHRGEWANYDEDSCGHPANYGIDCKSDKFPNDCPLRNGPLVLALFTKYEANTLFGILPEDMRQILAKGGVPPQERIEAFFKAVDDSSFVPTVKQEPALKKLRLLI